MGWRGRGGRGKVLSPTKLVISIGRIAESETVAHFSRDAS